MKIVLGSQSDARIMKKGVRFVFGYETIETEDNLGFLLATCACRPMFAYAGYA